ncbi:hypothetical protein AMELA_G00017200 [Ameiurus melas]|uniref:Uncharacterized protein n=1 Tax=Ameiurus melas TaxID=219545 RepID=A0A7J6BAV6_AMEME|nr:hypothetical protein AMELA_G00017200 [Ameiurus melas]
MRQTGYSVFQPKLSVIGCQAERAVPSVTGHAHDQQTFEEDETLKRKEDLVVAPRRIYNFASFSDFLESIKFPRGIKLFCVVCTEEQEEGGGGLFCLATYRCSFRGE